MLKELGLAACRPKAMRWDLANPPKADLCPRGFDGSAAPAGRGDWSCTAHSQNR